MAADYPGQIPALSNSGIVAGQSRSGKEASSIAEVREELKAALTELGTNPAGSATDVDERFLVDTFTKAVNGLGYVNAGSNVNTARPTSGFAAYVWLCTAEPVNMANGDIWLDPTP